MPCLNLKEPSMPMCTAADIAALRDPEFDPCFDGDQDDVAIETLLTKRQVRRILAWVCASVVVVYVALTTCQNVVETSRPGLQYSITGACLYCVEAVCRTQAACHMFPEVQNLLAPVCVSVRDAYRVSCMLDEFSNHEMSAARLRSIEDALEALKAALEGATF